MHFPPAACLTCWSESTKGKASTPSEIFLKEHLFSPAVWGGEMTGSEVAALLKNRLEWTHNQRDTFSALQEDEADHHPVFKAKEEQFSFDTSIRLRIVPIRRRQEDWKALPDFVAKRADQQQPRRNGTCRDDRDGGSSNGRGSSWCNVFNTMNPTPSQFFVASPFRFSIHGTISSSSADAFVLQEPVCGCVFHLRVENAARKTRCSISDYRFWEGRELLREDVGVLVIQDERRVLSTVHAFFCEQRDYPAILAESFRDVLAGYHSPQLSLV
ncbi:hypothetical protein ACRALDRAFT_1069344 [Sodiomyces alcalophilus JCM 7366]|uniref:uncharacterized protein n=1 Tax=Sodiomyces alcalophilus JCM 7366 TaxID=591952 RepID=UPI0039B63FC8